LSGSYQVLERSIDHPDLSLRDERDLLERRFSVPVEFNNGERFALINFVEIERHPRTAVADMFAPSLLGTMQMPERHVMGVTKDGRTNGLDTADKC
jgi:hypothetical protein